MPSSTSSSEHARVDPHHAGSSAVERAVPVLGRAGWIALLVFLAGMAAMESWARNLGVPSGDYRGSPGAWAEQRRRINQGDGDAWVIIGSSRIYYDLQIPVWQRLDGRAPIQLAIEGTSPVRVMEGLAEDPDFTGKLVVGIAPGLFFSGFEFQANLIDAYEGETPAQWFGHKVSVLFEPWLAFYTPDLALPAILERQSLPIREGADYEPEVRKLVTRERNRNARLWKRLEEDEAYRDEVRDTWARGWVPMAERPEERQKKAIESRNQQIERAVVAYEKLRTRGVEVVFAVMPYDGHYAVSEPDGNPRELSWDELMRRTGAVGLHFEDHAEMQGYWLPEWSHMTASEADRFTAAFYPLVMRELEASQQQETTP